MNTKSVAGYKPEIYLLSVWASLSWKLSFQIWHFTCPGKRESVILDPCIKIPDFSIPNSICLLWFEPCLSCPDRTLCKRLYSHMIPWTKVEYSHQVLCQSDLWRGRTGRRPSNSSNQIYLVCWKYTLYLTVGLTFINNNMPL